MHKVEAGHADVKSDKNGIVSFTELSYGTYYVKEIAAPKGYQLSTEVRMVTVDGEVVDAGTFDNELIIVEKGSIQFTKVEKGTNKKLEGAIFRLYVDKECTKEAGHADVKSNEDGIVSFTNLPYGTYYVKEIVAPEGYQLSTEIRKVTVDKEKVDEKRFDNVPIKDETELGSIKIMKIDSKNKEVLEGAEFALYQGERFISTGKTDKHGIVTFEKLPYGTYYIKETKAPEGYQLSDAVITIEVNGNQTVEIEFENHLIEKEVITDSPEDDSSNIQVLVPEEPLASNPAGGVTEDSEDHNKTNIDVIDRLPQTGDTSSRILITLGIVLIMAGILLLTKRAKR